MSTGNMSFSLASTPSDFGKRPWSVAVPAARLPVSDETPATAVKTPAVKATHTKIVIWLRYWVISGGPRSKSYDCRQ